MTKQKDSIKGMFAGIGSWIFLILIIEFIFAAAGINSSSAGLVAALFSAIIIVFIYTCAVFIKNLA